MDMTDAALSALVDAAIANGLCEQADRTYMINGLLAVLHRGSFTEPEQPLTGKSIPALLDMLCDDAAARGLLQADTTVCRDLFSAALMGVLMPRPSQVIRQFRADYAVSPQQATDRFYRLCCDCDYVMTERIRRDLHWQSDSPYGVLDIVVGSLATLIAALITSRCRNVWLAALPPVVCNMVLVGAVLAYEQAGTSAAFWPAYGLNAVTVGAGEAIACLVLGVLLVKQLPKIPYFRDRLQSK